MQFGAKSRNLKMLPGKRIMNRRTLLAIATILAFKKKKKRKPSKPTKSLIVNDYVLSNTIISIPELRLENEEWFNCLRMDEETYLELLNIVTPAIQRKDTLMRKAISPHERLAATLRFLSTGLSYEDMKSSALISAQSLGRIIPETCRVLYEKLRAEYIKFPTSKEEWEEIACGFQQQWNFPNCLGAVDGKHVRITPPKGSGSYFLNYKGYNSLVLIAVANANYEFMMVDIGTNGHVSTEDAIENTKFYDYLKDGKLRIPPASIPENGTQELPYVFVGDEAFSLRPDLLKSYSQGNLTQEQRVFNYRLSRAHHVIQNSFGILASRFKVFGSPINMKLENIEIVVMACCVLHNFLRRKRPDYYTPTENLDSQDSESGSTSVGLRCDTQWINGLQPDYNPEIAKKGEEIRDLYLHHFNNEGAVPWQDALYTEMI